MAMPFTFFNPIFTRGESNLTSATGTYDDGDTTITFDNSGGNFVVGSHIFASKGDDSIPQYLGQATAAVINVAGSVDLEIPLSRGFSTDTLKLWKPTKFWRPEWSINRAFQILPEKGLETTLPSGGGAVNVRTAAFRERLTGSFDPVRPNDLQNWETFVFVDLTGGDKRMNVSYFDQRKDRSRLATVSIVGRPVPWNMDTEGYRATFVETFIVLPAEEDSFLTAA